MKKLTLLFSLCLFIGIGAVSAQMLNLLNFDNTNGQGPYGDLTLAGTKLYGMTPAGGANAVGCIFSMDVDGNNYRDLFDFNGSNGASPDGSLLLVGNKLIGMTSAGGINTDGVVFSIDTNGSNYRDLFDFNGLNGQSAQGSLTVWGSKLFGMTETGGINNGGNLFSIDTNGDNFKNLYSFSAAAPNGALILSTTGTKLFGMTEQGGLSSGGNIFSIDTNGNNYKDLFDFVSASGINPYGSLSSVGKKLYGLTNYGGTNSDGSIFVIDSNGNNYKDIFDFSSSIGANPYGSLTLSGSLLYGLAQYGGANSEGSIFSIDTNGTQYKDMFDFNGTNGAYPNGDVTIVGSTLYGMTNQGGAINNNGIVFKFDTVLFAMPSDTNIVCNGINSGTVSVTATGGTAPYAYLWSGVGSQTNASATGLSIGTYTVTVSDDVGHSATATAVIKHPDAMGVSVTTMASCHGLSTGKATALVSGGDTPFTYSWSGGNSQIGATATGLSMGSYTITVSDFCSSSSTVSTNITQPNAVSASATGQVSCNGNNHGSAMATPGGGTPPYTYLWSGNGAQTTVSATGLSAGTYTVLVSDSCGGSSTASAIVVQAAIMNISTYSVTDSNNCDGIAAVTVTGGATPYTYAWSPSGGTTDTITGQCANQYVCTITQNNGCAQTANIIISNTNGILNITGTAGRVSVYPNPNNGNFVIGVSVASVQSYVEIYNILGEQIKSEKLKANNTVIDMSSEPGGVYLYKVVTLTGNLIGQGKLVIEK